MSEEAPIVCGVDGSSAARAAVRLSAALAGRLGVSLVVADATGRDAGRRLLEAADGAALLALGRPVRAAVARRAPCPLLVVPPVPRLGGTSVVCGVRDWADVATAEVAAWLAFELGLELALVCIVPPGPDDGPFEPPWDDVAAYHLLDGVAATVGAAPKTHVAYGAPGPSLAREAIERNAAALVIGAPRYGLVGSTLTGSASIHLLRRTRRPLMVCPALQRPPLLPSVSASGSW
jgi:nucleotide-binding universal stress UspA family protein